MIIKCDECGHEISDTAEICPSCGKRIREPMKTAGMKPVIILLSLILALGFVSAGYFILNDRGVFQKAEVQEKTPIEEDEKLINAGMKTSFFPLGMEELSFKDGSESKCVCTKIMPVGDGFYELAFTAPKLSNSTADGTYAVTVSYIVKVGDEILLKDYDILGLCRKLKITHLAPNSCWYKIARKND